MNTSYERSARTETGDGASRWRLSLWGMGCASSAEQAVRAACQVFETSGTSTGWFAASSRRAMRCGQAWRSSLCRNGLRAEHITEGRCRQRRQLDDDILSYAGSVTKWMVSRAMWYERGRPLFVIEAAATVQAHERFGTALEALNTARSTNPSRPRSSRNVRTISRWQGRSEKDWQQAQFGSDDQSE